MKNISIIGDSWGCGEWKASPDGGIVTHKGTEHFLSESGYSVKNYSKGGGSGKYMLEQLEKYDIKNEILLVFHTDSCRDIRDNLDVALQYMQKKNVFIKKVHEFLFAEWIKKFVQATKNRNCEVILIGGHANLYKNVNLLLPTNIKVLTHSWIQDITNTKVGDLSGLDRDDLEDFITNKPIDSDEQKQEIIDIMTEKSKRLYLLKHHIHFPDDHHPDRFCHQKLSERILQFIG